MGLTLSIERKKAIMVIHFGFHNGLLHFHIHIFCLLGLDSSLLTSISSGTLFQARNNCVRKRKKPSSLKQENGLESGADSQRPF